MFIHKTLLVSPAPFLLEKLLQFASFVFCVALVLFKVNYYARNDPLVKLDRRAAELMKLTNNTKFQEVKKCWFV